MPLIAVTLMEGRTPEKKRALIRERTDAVERALSAPRKRFVSSSMKCRQLTLV